MLVRRVVDDKINNDLQATLFRLVSEIDEVPRRSVLGIHGVVVADVVSIVAIRTGLKRLQPDARCAQTRDVIEFPRQTLEVTNSVAIGVHVGSNVDTVNDGILVPEVVDHGFRLVVVAIQGPTNATMNL